MRAGRGALWAPARSIAVMLVGLALVGVAAGAAEAQGHGPAFGLSTPTLGKGAWSLDIGLMSRFAGGTSSTMARPMLSYGFTPDFQISASVPVPLDVRDGLPQSRGMTRMPMNRDVELILGWRFHRSDMAIGSRFESTVYGGVIVPTVADRSGIETGPGLWGALATGYASRSLYVWAGALYSRQVTSGGLLSERRGDVAMYSAVVGYRPEFLRRDYPHADWRIFVELVGERIGRDRIAGVSLQNTGGHQLFVGPTVLGIFGAWGISGGPVFPVYRSVNGFQPRESVRVIVNTTFWFF